MNQFHPIEDPTAQNPLLSRIQAELQRVLLPVTKKIILDGRLIAAIPMTAGVQRNIEHGLGRDVLGWMLVDQDASTNVWRSSSANPDRYLSLTSSATATISLWVF